MKVEAVTVCVNYASELAEVASHNRRLLDRWIVVTTPQDEETRKVCAKHSIETILCDEFQRDGAQFAKARGINAGLRQLQGDGWLLHIDADICLPTDFGECLEDAHVIPGNVYGCNRLCVPGPDVWDKVVAHGLHSRQNGWLAEYRDRPNGCYLGGQPAMAGIGYAPIGFFQLWWGAETLAFGHGKKWYPPRHGGAARSDVQFSCLWDRRHRLLIPELTVFHLENPEAQDKMGHNWNGRKFPPFRPKKHHGHHHKHHGHHHKPEPSPYC